MGFGFDMTKAKNIHKENIRFAREEKLKGLDIEFQKALETWMEKLKSEAFIERRLNQR